MNIEKNKSFFFFKFTCQPIFLIVRSFKLKNEYLEFSKIKTSHVFSYVNRICFSCYHWCVVVFCTHKVCFHVVVFISILYHSMGLYYSQQILKTQSTPWMYFVKYEAHDFNSFDVWICRTNTTTYYMRIGIFGW